MGFSNKAKQKVDGFLDMFKARLVAKGFEQQGGPTIQIHSTRLVVKFSTIRTILAIVVQFDWSISQLYVSNVLLHDHLEEEVYMEQPTGFHVQHFLDYICKHKKAIYGLK